MSFQLTFIEIVVVHPLVKVDNEVTKAALGSNISLTCTVESSPKSINMWMKTMEDGRRE